MFSVSDLTFRASSEAEQDSSIDEKNRHEQQSNRFEESLKGHPGIALSSRHYNYRKMKGSLVFVKVKLVFA